MFQRVASPLVAIFLALMVSTSFVNAADGGQTSALPDFAPWLDTSDRDTVIDAYQAAFTRDVPAMNWTGAVEGCAAGDSSDRLREETLSRIEYYRAMAGVPAVVSEDAALSEKAQAAALMMSVEGRLTHSPGPDYGCYSSAGQEAAANSNLYLGRTGPRAIDGYIEDPGEDNIDVGHRSTILHPPTATMGIGHVAGSDERYPANALWVFDDNVFEKDYQTREPERFVAWPPRGFVPAPVVYPRWSFALQEADFSNAQVTMTTEAGESIDLDVVARISKNGEIPSSVIVWEPDLRVADLGADLGVVVTVSGVVHPDNQAKPGVLAVSAPDQVGANGDDRFVQQPDGSSSFSYRVVIIGRDLTPSLLQELWRPVSSTTSVVDVTSNDS